MTYLLKHYDSSKSHGQLNLFIYFIITGLLFLALAIYVKIYGSSSILFNDAILHLFRGIRSTHIDPIMMNVTLLGQKQVILPVVVVLFGWLLLAKRWRAAFHALALGILAAGSVFVFKNIILSPRPWGISFSPETYSMPSGHATLATTVFMGYAFLVAGSLRSKYRWIIYSLGIIVTVMVGITRLYLGAHWFTDIIGSWLLSTAVLLIVIISYERRRERPIKPVGMTLVTLAALIITFSIYHYRHQDEMAAIYAQVDLPTSTIAMNEWWQKNDALPAYRASLFGLPSEHINIEWAGDLDIISDTLNKEGWSKPPARDLISTMHRIGDIKSSQYLPMISPQYLDKRPALILVRQADGEKGLLALRLWHANRTIKETQSDLWVGIIGVIPRSYSWLFKSRPGEIAIDPALIFPKKTRLGLWQWKIMVMDQPTGTKQIISQKIMLIRPNKSVHKKL